MKRSIKLHYHITMRNKHGFTSKLFPYFMHVRAIIYLLHTINNEALTQLCDFLFLSKYILIYFQLK